MLTERFPHFLRAATAGTDDGRGSNTMYCLTTVARKPKGHFSVERQMCRRMDANALRDLKNAPDSRRNPVEQLHKALFGYFFPPWKKYHMLLHKNTPPAHAGEVSNVLVF